MCCDQVAGNSWRCSAKRDVFLGKRSVMITSPDPENHWRVLCLWHWPWRAKKKVGPTCLWGQQHWPHQCFIPGINWSAGLRFSLFRICRWVMRYTLASPETDVSLFSRNFFLWRIKQYYYLSLLSDVKLSIRNSTQWLLLLFWLVIFSGCTVNGEVHLSWRCKKDQVFIVWLTQAAFVSLSLEHMSLFSGTYACICRK